MREFAHRQTLPICNVPHPNPSPACGRGAFQLFYRADLSSYIPGKDRLQTPPIVQRGGLGGRYSAGFGSTGGRNSAAKGFLGFLGSAAGVKAACTAEGNGAADW